MTTPQALSEAQMAEAVKLALWLAMPHKVSFLSYKEACYWGHQFAIAQERAQSIFATPAQDKEKGNG